MKTKETISKRKKRTIKLTLKNGITFLTFILSILYTIIFYNYYFGRNKVYAKETSTRVQETKISKAQKINIEEVINQNINIGQKEEYIVEETILEYITKYKNNEKLPKGKMQVIQEGRQGKQEIVTKKIYEEGTLISEQQVSSKITKAAMDKIVEIGTGNNTNIFEPKVGDTIQVTSDRLPVMVEPNEQSQKVTTLSKGERLKLLETEGTWYKISCLSTIGYVKSENTKSIEQETKQEIKKENEQQTKQSIHTNISFDMALNQSSGLTLEQFKKILTDDKDTYKIFEENAAYFYYIEQQYKINGVFVAAVGIHESAWGTSKIAREKNNLFGYGAYDSNPYNGAYHFSTYSESIDLLARVFVKYYINPKGTNIYGGEQAIGTYYNGSTLNGVNKKYATDKNWANGVFQTMKYLYNKL